MLQSRGRWGGYRAESAISAVVDADRDCGGGPHGFSRAGGSSRRRGCGRHGGCCSPWPQACGERQATPALNTRYGQERCLRWRWASERAPATTTGLQAIKA